MPTGKKDTQSINEKDVLEKATGQKAPAESDKVSKTDIQQLNEQIDVAELIQLSMKNAEQIRTVKLKLDTLYQQRDDYKKRQKVLKQILKPVSRSLKKLHTTKSSPQAQPRDKKVFKAEQDDLDHQLFLTGEEIALNESELSRLTGKSSKHSKEIKLRSKANGRDYTKRNKPLFTSKMLKVLNTFRQTSDAELISNIRVLARATDPDGFKLFKQEFGAVVEAIDVETFILCSGLLSDFLYSAARLTILSKSASFKGDFEELVMPEEK
jgi:hypothetical protein